ncbi:hypothetical protein ACIOVF_07290 [Pseudomonas sp. NPDC087612]
MNEGTARSLPERKPHNGMHSYDFSEKKKKKKKKKKQLTLP